ncbi:hypothetical protein HG530_010127 [Fusarium avenaceum]|nr:hypothetical protein HG530_010127 [Fusarium avenaceum]
MNTEIRLLLLRKNPQDAPTSSSALESSISESLCSEGMNNLLTQQQLAALLVLDDVGYSRGSSGASLWVGALELADDG